jgi:hypothetical protein
MEVAPISNSRFSMRQIIPSGGRKSEQRDGELSVNRSFVADGRKEINLWDAMRLQDA